MKTTIRAIPVLCLLSLVFVHDSYAAGVRSKRPLLNDNQVLVAEGDKAAQAKVFDIMSYGAIGDGVAMETN